jgi:hypothetical protein
MELMLAAGPTQGNSCDDGRWEVCGEGIIVVKIVDNDRVCEIGLMGEWRRRRTHGHGACSPFSSEFRNQFMSIRFSICHTGSLSISSISLLLWFDLIPSGKWGSRGHTNLTVNGTIISSNYGAGGVTYFLLKPCSYLLKSFLIVLESPSL